MYTITKEFYFSASHKLESLPKTHPCANLHGHNYTVIIELKSEELNETGFVTDYRTLNSAKNYIDEMYDHKDLNVMCDFNPTAENLAKHLFDVFKGVYHHLNAVEVKETEKTKARYEL